jgi:hypothetical protein
MLEISGTTKRAFAELTFDNRFNKRVRVLMIESDRFPQDLELASVKPRSRSSPTSRPAP